MTQVVATKFGGLYTSLEVKGHANFAISGKDLVCASVSAIVFGLANAICEAEGDRNISWEDASFCVKNLAKSELISHYLSCVVTQLLTLEEAYPANIRVEILERRPYEV